MNKKLTKEWFYAAFIRMIRTMAQVALSMFTIGAALSEIDWLRILSVSVVAGVYSLLTSIVTTLPEVGTDGVLAIDDSDPEKQRWQLNLTTLPENVQKAKTVHIKVEPNADLKAEFNTNKKE